LIDRIRKDIQEHLDQLVAEAEKLRHALAALDPREKSPAKPKAKRTQKPAERSASATASTRAPRSAASRKRAASKTQESSPVRTAPGATKAKVLGALSADGAMTAGEVAKATGLGRATVSTTLTKLAKSGEAVKAERGYRLPAISAPAVPGAGSTEA
jgi:biotin operon repressor